MAMMFVVGYQQSGLDTLILHWLVLAESTRAILVVVAAAVDGGEGCACHQRMDCRRSAVNSTSSTRETINPS